MVTSTTSTTSSFSGPSITSRTSTAHMRHSDLYSAILELLVFSQPNNVRVLRLQAYTRAEVHTGAEKRLVSALISQLRRLEVLELGHAVADDILEELGRSCRHLRKLKIAGPAITDTGLGLLCSEGSQSGLCLSLVSLSLLATTSLTLEAVLQALHHLQHLTHLSLQENLVLQILRREEREREGRIVPVRQLEVTVGPGRRDYLTPASTIAPLLTSITLWCFESENVSSLSGRQSSSPEIT